MCGPMDTLEHRLWSCGACEAVQARDAWNAARSRGRNQKASRSGPHFLRGSSVLAEAVELPLHVSTRFWSHPVGHSHPPPCRDELLEAATFHWVLEGEGEVGDGMWWEGG